MEVDKEELKEHLDVIKLDKKEFLILGTAHISKQSVREVELIIEGEEIDCVCVELDQARYDSIQDSQSYLNLDIFKIVKERRSLLMLVNLVLSSHQKKMGQDLDIKPGMEMLRAIELAKEKNISISLCDRSIQTTLTRTWRKSSLFAKFDLILTLMSSAFSKEEITEKELENLKKRNELEVVLEDMGKQMPKIKEVLIDERDEFLAKKIFDSEGKRIFAVVGAGHKKGIIEYINKLADKNLNFDINIDKLNEIPKKSLGSKVFPYFISILIIALIAWKFITGDRESGVQNILMWILINGSFSAIGGIIALAHPLVILVSFLAAPITSLIPFTGVGLICGFLQAWLKKPKVIELESLVSDAGTLKGYYKNSFLKSLLVLALTGFGSMIATFVAIPFLLA